jgi:hypothetical protein
MSETAEPKKCKVIKLEDVQEINNLSDYLKQEPVSKKQLQEQEVKISKSLEKALARIKKQKAKQMKLNEKKEVEDGKKEMEYYTETDEYVCQNPGCQYLDRRDELTSLHNFEIYASQIITICNFCYESNYRFCLFTHEVLHIDELEPVLDGMYAQPKYNQNQLNPDLLAKADNVVQYLNSIGIDNPYPTQTTIDLSEQLGPEVDLTQ